MNVVHLSLAQSFSFEGTYGRQKRLDAVICEKQKYSQAVRSRNYPKLIFASCVVVRASGFDYCAFIKTRFRLLTTVRTREADR